MLLSREEVIKMIKINTYTPSGAKSADFRLPSGLEEKENSALLAQAIRVYEDRRHPGRSKTKTRGEIRTSTRKIYRQKGTGLARHGAKSAPIFVGGGKAHGPKGVKRVLKLPKKMKRKVLGIAISMKADADRLVLVKNIFKIKKTKDAASLINKIAKSKKVEKKHPRISLVLSKQNKDTRLAFRNIENLEVLFFENLNARDIYYGGLIVIDRDALQKEKASGGKKTSSEKTKKKK